MTRKEFVESRVQKCISERERGREDCINKVAFQGGMTEDYYLGYAEERMKLMGDDNG